MTKECEKIREYIIKVEPLRNLEKMVRVDKRAREGKKKDTKIVEIWGKY